jgi:hypothetical protein
MRRDRSSLAIDRKQNGVDSAKMHGQRGQRSVKEGTYSSDEKD